MSIGLLVEGYLGVILDRCRLKLRSADDAVDVAHEVVVRLLAELKRGRRYRVPFRVVVHKVIEWKVEGALPGDAVDEDELEDWLLERLDRVGRRARGRRTASTRCSKG